MASGWFKCCPATPTPPLAVAAYRRTCLLVAPLASSEVPDAGPWAAHRTLSRRTSQSSARGSGSPAGG